MSIYKYICINKLKKQFERAAQYVCIECMRNNVVSHLNGKAAKKVFGFHFMQQGPNLALQSKIHPCFGMLPALSIPVNTTMASSVFITLPKKT